MTTDKYHTIKKIAIWGLSFAAIGAVILIRTRLLNIPLERDEGEYAYMAQSLLRGIPPYVSAYSVKFPGIYGFYALIMSIFGQTSAGIHLGLCVVNILSAAILFFLARRFFDPQTSVFAAALFTVLTVDVSILGLTANAEHFVLFFALWGIWTLVRALKRSSSVMIFFSGMLLGCSVLVKQHGAFFLLFGCVYVLSYYVDAEGKGWRYALGRTTRLAAGAAVPFIGVCAYYFSIGRLDDFVFWSIDYARHYIYLVHFDDGMGSLARVTERIFQSDPIVWIGSALGIILLVREKRERKTRAFLLALALFSLCAVLPGLYFRRHYFIYIMPAAALIFAFLYRAINVRSAIVSGFCAAAALIYPLAYNAPVFFSDPQKVLPVIYKTVHPFTEAYEAGRYIARVSAPRDQVLVLGSEPEICFYARRSSPAKYLYMYPFSENHPYAARMQDEFRHELVNSAPAYIVLVNMVYSWVNTPADLARLDIFNWLAPYYSNGYDIVGVIDDVGSGSAVYRWGDGAKEYTPRSENSIFIFKKKSAKAQ